jgi:hypothetical protein
MTVILRTLMAASLIVLLQRCTPVYSPNIRNTPFFEKAGEVQIQGYYDPLKAFSGTALDAQGGVSITNHVAVIGSYAQSHMQRVDYILKHKYEELGGGYYRMFNKRFSADFFGGYGKGIVDGQDIYNSLQNDLAPLRLYYDRYFIQGVFLLKGKFFVFSPSMRLSYVTFNKYEKLGVQYAFHQSGNLFFEPCGAFQFNGRESKNAILSHGYILVQVGANFSFNHSTEGVHKFKYEYGYAPINTSLGVGLRIGPVSKK